MPHDIEDLKRWIQICLIVAGLCATAIPVLYAFSTWNRSWLGRSFMAYTITIAVVLDVTAVFQFWHPTDIEALFWVNATSFTLITVTSIMLALVLLYENHGKWIRRRKIRDGGSSSASS